MRLIQIATAAMRDPVTGEFLPSIPLYASAEDAENIAEPLGYSLRELGKKVDEYRRQARKLEDEAKERKEARKQRRRPTNQQE